MLFPPWICYIKSEISVISGQTQHFLHKSQCAIEIKCLVQGHKQVPLRLGNLTFQFGAQQHNNLPLGHHSPQQMILLSYITEEIGTVILAAYLLNLAKVHFRQRYCSCPCPWQE